MDDQNNSDHLNSSLTDLMTSLMVIFILLLLVFVHRTAVTVPVVRDEVLKQLRHDLQPQGFNDKTVVPDPKDLSSIRVIVPDGLMNFETGKSALRPKGKDFLTGYVPKLAKALCSDSFRPKIESVVVEGHTDRQPYPGLSAEESQNRNLQLSQERSMEVVRNTLSNLAVSPPERACFLEKLSASGRGEQDQEATADESRRVIFKIRVKAADADRLKDVLK